LCQYQDYVVVSDTVPYVHLETFWMNVWAPSSVFKIEESGCSKMLMFVWNGFNVTGFW